jgi:bifunctional non-homologous end joining protein LigD
MPRPAVTVDRVAVRIIGAMQTPDGQWRVEAVEENRSLPNRRPYISKHYRLIHGDNVVDNLVIATLQRLLEEVGVEMGDLVEAPEDAPAAQGTRSGAA